jgi:hypothetical protein
VRGRRLAALVGIGLAGVIGPLAAQTKTERRFAVLADAAVRVTNLVGSIDVTGWDRDSVAVTAMIPPGAGGLFAAGSGRLAKLGIDGIDPSLAGPGAKLVVSVPRNARVWIKSASATVTVKGVSGEIEVTSITGRVAIDGEPRVVTIESIDGRVDIVGAATLTRVKSGTGAVHLIGVRGDFSVTTVQGSATVETDEVLSGRIETVSGPVEVSGALPSGARLDLVTHDGEIRAHLGRPIDARFDLATIEGRIVTHLFDQPDRIYTDRSAAFWVGPSAGLQRGATLTIRSFKGNIRVDSNPKAVRGVS